MQNPQNKSGMDKNILIVFAVTMLGLVLAQQFLLPKPKPGQKPQQQTQQTQSAPAPAAQNPGTIATPAATPAPVVPANAVQAAAESETVIENDLYRITFSNRGGQVKSWVLKKFKDNNGKLGLELVHQQAAAQYGLPLSLWTWDEGLRQKLNSALYVVNSTGNAGSAQSVTFEYADGDIAVKKEFTFGESYLVGIKTSVRRGSSYIAALPTWPAGFGDAAGLPSYAEQRIDYVATGQDVKRLKLDRKGADISSGRLLTGNYQWVGASDAYFGAIFLPERAENASFVELRNSIQIPKDEANPNGDKAKAEVLGVAVGSLDGPSSVRLFAGPKAMEILKSVHSENGADIQATLDYGMFGFIGRPLFAWVQWTQQHLTPNWGWTIILVTVIINVALLPLRITQLKSSMKMQKLAPEMQSIQDKFKKYKLDDPRRQDMQKEVAALYKAHDVNPVGGCLPLVIQMPFLIAFYTMLRNAFELRQAPWMFLSDLSSPDHFHIIPIATIVMMMLMQRMMPTAGMSKEQQQMMNMMTPVMFAVFTWSVASGLGLYIITGTLVSIIQQMIMNRTPLGREMRALAEKRAQKLAEKKR
ncbi:MAG: membrane protein insertase YidC [Acidobacteriota bacterium]|nr:membrane protein insertase YidC [Acidobacteriota bacterium]